MNMIVAVDRQWAIGKEGELLCHLPGDLQYYKEKTLNKTIIMGRKTLESLPGGKPLPKRKNIILTRDENFKEVKFENRDYIAVNSKEEAFELLENTPKEEIMVSGGEQIYKMLLPECDKVYVTKIDKIFQGDVFFPDLDQSNEFEITWQGDAREENNISYTFYVYERKKSEK